MMVRDGVLFGASLFAITIGTCCMIWPQWFIRSFRGEDDQTTESQGAPPKRSELWKIRIFGFAVFIFGVTFLLVSIFGVLMPPGFDPNLF